MFTLLKKRGNARRGIIKTDHGEIETPNFMFVATQATVKGVTSEWLKEAGAQFIIANTYHLYLRPGLEIMKESGGLHRFMDWERPIFTDSGGFQVLSLSKLRKFEDDGVLFQSHIDGSYHKFTPQNNVHMQRVIGGDVIMVLDECTEYPATHEYARFAMNRTMRWAKEAREEFLKGSPLYGHKQFQFGIVQGSVYEDLRIECAEKMRDMDFDGYSIGGVAIGESKEYIRNAVKWVAPILPENKARYLMGVGDEDDIRASVENGIDLFDCVVPTRNARNGALFTKNGKIIIRNAKYKNDYLPVEEGCECTLCRNHTRAYLHHLFKAREMLGGILATEHNIHYYLRLMKEIRERI